MNEYYVTLSETVVTVFRVQAETPEDAVQAAKDEADNSSLNEWSPLNGGYTVESVEQVDA